MPTVLVEFGLMEDLCSLNLSQTHLFVLPTYCGLEVQCADPFLQVIQYHIQRLCYDAELQEIQTRILPS